MTEPELKLPLDSNEIQKILPHRYPFLLVDRIDAIEDGTIRGRKAVTANEMQFLGHFPDQHVMPGVLIVEALAQTGAVMLLSMPENQGHYALLAGINKMRFKKQVVPGDMMILECTLLKMRRGIGVAAVKATVDDQTACEGEIMFAISRDEK